MVKNFRSQLEITKHLVWPFTLMLTIIWLPWLREMIVWILMKLYQLIIQNASAYIL